MTIHKSVKLPFRLVSIRKTRSRRNLSVSFRSFIDNENRFFQTLTAGVCPFHSVQGKYDRCKNAFRLEFDEIRRIIT